MRSIKRLTCAVLGLLFTLTACGSPQGAEPSSAAPAETEAAQELAQAPITSLKAIPRDGWQYNAETDVYWQVGLAYCESPADEGYETLGVFVPGAYFDAADNGDGTYTCTVNETGTVAGFTARTAPVVIPVNTPGYAAMAAPTGYVSEASTYTAAGFVYVNAGCRGRDAGAPAGVTDLKAAIRYVRYSAENIAGDTQRFFSFGMSGGGAQSALLGATGDSSLYDPYLEAIGAVQGVSDALLGSMCWCPITNLDVANEAYEWNLGVSREGLDQETQALSDGMALAFAQYINDLGLVDGQGNALTLVASEEGIYQAGSYYDYLKGVVEESLNHFLSDTTFPYTAQSSGMGGGMMMGGGRFEGELPQGDFDRGEMGQQGAHGAGGKAAMGGQHPTGGQMGDLPEDLPQGQPGGFVDGNGQFQADGIDRNGGASGGLSLTGTYETARDYVDALNAEGAWVSYDEAANTVTITSLEDFVKRLKTATKSVGAFDDLNATQGENVLFGYGDGSGAHFDPIMARLLAELNSTYAAAYAADLARTDVQGNTAEQRMDLYNPMYYLCDYYDGVGASSVAQYWRIRTGIEQGDTALCTEVNLALALASQGADVDFETVWGQGHTQAERTGTSSENFIAWVNDCLGN